MRPFPLGTLPKDANGKISINFETWMRLVDSRIQASTSLVSLDLPDLPYMDMYEAGVTPRSAAAKAIKNAKSES